MNWCSEVDPDDSELIVIHLSRTERRLDKYAFAARDAMLSVYPPTVTPGTTESRLGGRVRHAV